MSNTQIYMRRLSDESLEDVASYFIKSLESDMVAPELITKRIDNMWRASVMLLVFEKYYIRTNSMANLTIQAISCDGEQTLTIVGSGGGEGVLNISWGSNRNFAERVSRIADKMGFQFTPQNIKKVI